MYCRNCAHEVHDKAIACPKCGVNPHTEKNFCPACGNATQPNQIACTNCGVSLVNRMFNIDTSTVQAIEIKDIAKSRTFKIVAVLAVIAIGIYAYVQYASHLHKGEAEKIISAQLGLPSPITEAIQYGSISFGWDTPTRELELQEKKMMTCVQEGDPYNNIYRINLTPAGKQYKLSDSSDTEGRKFHVIKLADREFGEIINLKESEDRKTAVVEYTVNYKNFTPFGEVIGIPEQEVMTKDGKTTHKAEAYFQKTDDGWRVVDDRTPINRALDELQKMQRSY